jgi:hypothetical protein
MKAISAPRAPLWTTLITDSKTSGCRDDYQRRDKVVREIGWTAFAYGINRAHKKASAAIADERRRTQ